MKILMWLSHGAEIPGGHRVQMQRTAAALRRLGVEVDVALQSDLPEGRWDLVHGFQLQPDSVEAARRRGLPVVISPIYWGLSYSTTGPEASASLRGLVGSANRGLRYLRASVRGRESLVRLSMRDMESDLNRVRSWSMADMLLPNAEGEARHIRSDLGVRTESRVVPNAIDLDLFQPHYSDSRAAGTVICVGRVEPHKNQLGLIRAMRGTTSLTLTIVGPPHPHHQDYYARCRAEAGSDVTMIAEVGHEALPELYAQHRTHVLPSWYETTGLVSLEAAASGCTVVTTSRGHAREYLGSDAWYCDPADPASITGAIEAATSATPSLALRDRIRTRYTWSHTARATLDAYETVLRRRHA